ncbi:glycosyltransferase family 4 protein, partial [Vibrio cholerae]|uniref:glycosyltransferase n=1 Tax=Vibrio cholerae TaxID=666 RepID=UPI002652EE83
EMCIRGSSNDDIVFFISPISGKKYSIIIRDRNQLEDLTTLVNLFIIADMSYPQSRNTINKYIFKFSQSRGWKWRCLAKLFSNTVFNRYNPFSLFFIKIFRILSVKKFNLKSEYKINLFEDFSNIDNLVLFGGVWNFQDKYESLISQAKMRGGNVIFMVYDMIPIVSEYVPDELRDMFRDYIPFVLEHADKIIVNSSSCKQDLSNYCLSKEIPLPSIEVVHLAHYLPNSSSKVDYLELPLRTRKLAKEKFLLCVGSIESRKNHINLLIIWRKFINSEVYNNEKLVIVGRFLWDIEPVLGLLQATGNLYGSVIVVESASEEELRYLYEKCKFSVYPSHYEGWGLPLGESLSYKKPCLHFDNSSLVEAGYGMTTPVSYPDYEQYYNMLSLLLTDEDFYQKECERIDVNNLRTWQDFAYDISAELSL